jgi:hypothetical protein
MLLPLNTAGKVPTLISILLSISLVSYPFTSALSTPTPLRESRSASLQVSEAFGVNYSFPDPQPKTEHLEMLAASGVRWVRMDMSWASIEKTKGQYDFGAYDSIFNGFAKYNLRPLVILGSHGQRNYPNRSGQYPYPPDTPEAQQAFTNWAVATVQRYKGRGIFWEVYNEPNNSAYWPLNADVQDYRQLSYMVRKAVKEAAPNEIQVGGALLFPDTNYLEETLKSGVLPFWNAVSLHPYRHWGSPETVRDCFKSQPYCLQIKSFSVFKHFSCYPNQ